MKEILSWHKSLGQGRRSSTEAKSWPVSYIWPYCTLDLSLADLRPPGIASLWPRLLGGVEVSCVQCSVCSVQCAMWSVQREVCSVQCVVCSVQCAVCSVQSTVCSVQCAVCSVQCVVCSVQCTLCSVVCWAMYNTTVLAISVAALYPVARASLWEEDSTGQTWSTQSVSCSTSLYPTNNSAHLLVMFIGLQLKFS